MTTFWIRTRRDRQRRNGQLKMELDAANARAEAAEQCAQALSLAVDGYRARAEAAERERDEMNENYQVRRDAHERAESEAASLRAVAEAHVADNVTLGEENAALRAEVKHHQTMIEAVRTNLTDRLDAANARIAELEAGEKDWKSERRIFCDSAHRMSIQLTAANARADAAESDLAAARDVVKELQTRLEASRRMNSGATRAESAANARAEAAESRERCEQRNAERWATMCRAAESEAASLRAENQRMQDSCDDCYLNHSRCKRAESRLAEATTLLDEAATWIESPQHQAAPGALMLARRIRERKPMAGDKATAMGFAPKGTYFIEPYPEHSTSKVTEASAPSARADAERAVLKAMSHLDEMHLQMVAELDDDGMWTMVAVAELALRAVKP